MIHNIIFAMRNVINTLSICILYQKMVYWCSFYLPQTNMTEKKNGYLIPVHFNG